MAELDVGQRKIVGDELDLLDPESVKMVEVGQAYPATITRLIRTTAGQVFGDATKQRRDDASLEEAKLRPVLWIEYEGEGFGGNATFTIPDVVGPNSSLGKFARRYGSLPSKGQKVSAHVDPEDGYFKIDL
jgi:hypothetical protein